MDSACQNSNRAVVEASRRTLGGGGRNPSPPSITGSAVPSLIISCEGRRQAGTPTKPCVPRFGGGLPESSRHNSSLIASVGVKLMVKPGRYRSTPMEWSGRKVPNVWG